MLADILWISKSSGSSLGTWTKCMTLLNCLIKKSMDMISQVLLLLLRKRSCHHCTVLSVTTKWYVGASLSTLRTRSTARTSLSTHSVLSIQIWWFRWKEGGGGYREMFFWDVFRQIVWFLREIYDIVHILSL